MDRPAHLARLATRRSSARLTISVPIKVSGLDAESQPFIETTQTIGVGRNGARIWLRQGVKPQHTISIENARLGVAAKATVVWVGERRSPNDPLEVGISLAEAKNIWGIEFPPDEWMGSRSAGAIGGSNTVARTIAKLPVASAASVAQVPRPATAPPPPPVVSRPAPAPGPAPPSAASPRPPAAPHKEAQEGLNAAFEDAFLRFNEQAHRMVKAQSETLEKNLSELAQRSRGEVSREFERLHSEVVQTTVMQLRKLAREELEQFARQLEQMQRQASHDALHALRERLASALAVLEAPAKPPTGK